MRKHDIPPYIVKTKKEASELTKNDTCGHKWKVGEKYYRVETMHATIPIADNAEVISQRPA